QSGSGASMQEQSANARADAIWRGALEPRTRTHIRPRDTAEAEAVWRGAALDWDDEPHDHAAEHRALFTRWFEELWNKKNYDIAYELVDPDFTAHGAGGQDIKQGPDGVIGMVKAWHAAM